MRIDIDDNRKRIKLFLENKVYTFMIEYLPNGKEYTHNGFITDLKSDDTIIFFDVVNKRIIYVPVSNCVVDYSNGKIIQESQARKIFQEFQDE